VVMRRSRRRQAARFRRGRRRVHSRIRVLRVEGEVLGLRTGESGGTVDGEEFFEEAVAFAALDVAAAAAGVGVGVERHLKIRGRRFDVVVVGARCGWSWLKAGVGLE
jgi:hypothetical protein